MERGYLSHCPYSPPLCNRIPVTRLTTQFSYQNRVFPSSKHRSAHTPVPSQKPPLHLRDDQKVPRTSNQPSVVRCGPVAAAAAAAGSSSRPPASNRRLSPRYSLPVLVKIPPGILGIVDSPQNLGLVQLLSYVP